MANIRKRGNTYQIRVSCVYDTQGKQVFQTMTWKPFEGVTERSSMINQQGGNYYVT